ncbi:amidohydrolase [Bailinhaonella thermotolerans]|uniref:Amidohydrolase n=1 Tax=Bailinhaonella thermotolerans TaxID=1070861 RepID=A0A3A4B3M5_9ACTN|nr:amidohydrolase [Bailinhaonella thermotolerans]RJL32629.1 amidohydrolase [Bailinhaonella thermotolerans]
MDVLFVNATFVTNDPARPRAEALLASEGLIAAVGDHDEVTRLAGDATVVDLGFRTALPGFVEAHGHPTRDMLLRQPDVIDVRAMDYPTGDAVLARMREVLQRAEPHSPRVFFGWDPLQQPGLPDPTRDFLDELAPNNPVVVLHAAVELAYANSEALRAAGLPGPGVMRGAPGLRAITTPLIRESAADLPWLLEREHQALAAAGITTVADLGLSQDLWAVAEDVARSPGARVRMRSYAPPGEPGRPGEGDAMLRRTGIKAWADGGPWTGDAAFTFDYLDSEAGRRFERRTPPSATAGELREVLAGHFPAGWQVACHAYGDAAVDLVLDVYDWALRMHPRPDHRLRIEHCGAMTPGQYGRAAELGVTCSLFPAEIYYRGDVMLDELFGPRAGGWCDARSALDAGLRISFHNDSPVTPPRPLRNIQSAVTRRALGSGRVLGPEHRVSVDEAVRAQTIDPAWQLFSDHEIGSLIPGKYADLVVLEEDPYTAEPDSIAEIGVYATFLAGVQTYQRG